MQIEIKDPLFKMGQKVKADRDEWDDYMQDDPPNGLHAVIIGIFCEIEVRIYSDWEEQKPTEWNYLIEIPHTEIRGLSRITYFRDESDIEPLQSEQNQGV